MSKPIYYAFFQGNVGPGGIVGVDLMYYRERTEWHHELLQRALAEGNERWANKVLDSFFRDVRAGRDLSLLILGWFQSEEGFWCGEEGLDTEAQPTTVEQLTTHPDYQLIVYRNRAEAAEACRKRSTS